MDGRSLKKSRQNRLGRHKMKTLTTAALTLGLFAMTGAAENAECKLSDIEIKQFDWRRTPVESIVQMVGEIVNHCQEDIGVELKFTFRDVDDKVVGVADQWVASVKNIKANSSFPFSSSTTILPNTSTIKRMTTEVIDIKKWKSR
jgi:hypothetical protein